MRFTLSAEQHQFAETLHKLLSNSDTPVAVRAWARGDHGPGLAIWRDLRSAGVPDLVTDGEAADVVVAFEALGYHAVPGPLVESMVVAPLLLPRPPEMTTVLAPPRVPLALDADVVDVVLLLSGGAIARVDIDTLEAVSSIDPARRLFRVTGRQISVQCGENAVERALDYAALAVSAQLVGAGRRLLDAAVAYAKQRTQYGRLIGQYQAVKHLLADVVTRLELVRPLVYGAAVAIHDRDGPRDVSAAKVAAGDAAYLAARTSLQVHGAIGYTAEHELGLWLTKVRALVGTWGDAAFHRNRVLAALEGA